MKLYINITYLAIFLKNNNKKNQKNLLGNLCCIEN